MEIAVKTEDPRPLSSAHAVEKVGHAENDSAGRALVRPAVPDDAEAVAAVHIASWQAAYRGQLPDDFLDGLESQFRARADFWRQEIASPRTTTHEIWVATLAGHLRGFVALGPARDANSRVTGEVYAIYVHPNTWRQGLGTMLFTRAMTRLAALGFSKTILWVLQSNTPARRFYELAGWSADGRTKLETLPGGIELREVCYQKKIRLPN